MFDAALFVQALMGLLAITNPLGAVPIFLGITEDMGKQERRRAVRVAVVAITAIILASAFAGRYVLVAFGLQLAALRVGGGLVIVLMGLEMLRGQKTRVQHVEQKPEGRASTSTDDDSIFVPFAMPTVAGPGAITTAITLSARSKGLVGHVSLILAILSVGALLYLVLSAAPILHRVLGARGQRIFLRFMGLILLSLGVQFLLHGLRDFFG